MSPSSQKLLFTVSAGFNWLVGLILFFNADLLLHVEMAAAVVRVGKPKFGAVATFSLQVFGATTQPPCSLLKN